MSVYVSVYVVCVCVRVRSLWLKLQAAWPCSQTAGRSWLFSVMQGTTAPSERALRALVEIPVVGGAPGAPNGQLHIAKKRF